MADAWEHWCGAVTRGDPSKSENTADGLPAPVCSGCRFEVPLNKTAPGEITLLYYKEGE